MAATNMMVGENMSWREPMKINKLLLDLPALYGRRVNQH